MTLWLVRKTVRRAPRRLVLGALGVAFPVAMFGATLFFVDDAARSMTRVALAPVQIEMRALTTSLNVDVGKLSRRLSAVPGVRSVEPFGAADVVVHAAGTSGGWTARLFAVDPSYLQHRPWLRVVSGQLASGAMLDQSLHDTPGFGSAKSITISLPGDAPPLALTLPVTGTADLRRATTWFSVPYGEVQGDIVTLPRALIIDFSTFERAVLPVLRQWATSGGLPPFDPGSDELPSASLEAHVSVDHLAYPSDPARAANFSGQFRRTLERQAAGAALVADNTLETLTEASIDATNAKILFLLLGIPGVLVAGALGIAAGSALAEARRREEALLRLRGATGGQVAGVAAAEAGIAGFVGSIIGLVVAALAVGAVTGHAVWSGTSPGRIVINVLLALGVGALVTGIRLVRLRRASRRSEVALERRLLERGWTPVWRRAYLDVVAIAVGGGILGINALAGGLKQDPTGSITSLALSFYVLLAPIALWLGLGLLSIRGMLAVLTRRTRPERARPLSSWGGASLRWFGRRPARTAIALLLGALAVAFGTEVVAFAATYRTAKVADARSALGSDLRLTPGDPLFTLPSLDRSGVVATSPFRLVPARAGGDRKTILAVDLASYQATVTVAPRIVDGRGFDGLAADPMGVVVSTEVAHDFAVRPGDTLPLIIYPDDFENSTNLKLQVVGVFRSFPPDSPFSEMVTSTAILPPSVVAPPDFYLARVAPGRSATAVAAELRRGPLNGKFGVSTLGNPTQRGLTALNLGGLSRIESLGGALVAAIGVAVLGAFLVLERRREFAILRATGASTQQVLTGPGQEGMAAVLGSVLIGVPVGLGLGMLTVRVLGLFFNLPPPLLSVPIASLAGLVGFMVATSAVALGGALLAVNRVRAATVLREP
ncbi:MAG: ABC transporter permease [Actinomycetota bacterium]|nr:ABC transporter permease [Actinomycetota bacterium]